MTLDIKLEDKNIGDFHFQSSEAMNVLEGSVFTEEGIEFLGVQIASFIYNLLRLYRASAMLEPEETCNLMSEWCESIKEEADEIEQAVATEAIEQSALYN